MEAVGIALLVVVLCGLLVWAVKGYLNKRTERIDPLQQYLTLAQLNERAVEVQKKDAAAHKALKEDVMNEMQHTHELIKKDLERGSEKFGELKKEIDKLGDKIQETSDLVLDAVVKAVARKSP